MNPVQSLTLHPSHSYSTTAQKGTAMGLLWTLCEDESTSYAPPASSHRAGFWGVFKGGSKVVLLQLAPMLAVFVDSHLGLRGHGSLGSFIL